ncbi:MAG: amidohydrolase [Flavobacteriales bacterium]|nr:amidohydrolase [Flavobacteriales bacterium]
MKKKLNISIQLALSIVLSLPMTIGIAIAQQNPTPSPPQSKSILILNAIAHIGNGEMIENSAIGFKDGKIELMADARLIRLSADAYDTTIYADGMHVYPGFIACNSTLGLLEIDAVRATNDMSDVGTFKPSMRAAIAYNTDSEIIPTVRSNGVLMGQITPRGGTISGTSSVMQFDAWNWEDAIIREDDGVHLNWPQVYHKHYDKGKVNIEKVKSYDQQLREIETFFDEAKAYFASKTGITEVRFEAIRGIVEGTQTLYVHADEAKSITETLNFKKKNGIRNLVLVGGYDAWMVSDDLKSNNVAVMLPRTHSLPQYSEDDIDLPFKIPKMVFDAGLTFCLQNSGGMERAGARNLPFLAGTAVAYGLPYEEAVKSITLSPAKILGIDSTCGSLETGKDAHCLFQKAMHLTCAPTN